MIYHNVPSQIITLARFELLGMPLPVAYAAVAAVIFWFALESTPFGRYLRAIGGGKEATRLAGVRVERVSMIAFVVASVTASLAGVWCWRADWDPVIRTSRRPFCCRPSPQCSSVQPRGAPGISTSRAP